MGDEEAAEEFGRPTSFVPSGAPGLPGCVAKTVPASNRANRQSALYRLAFQSEGFPDELNLFGHLPFRQPRHLTLPDHVQNLVALNPPACSIE
jgi:hypothetical protein